MFSAGHMSPVHGDTVWDYGVVVFICNLFLIRPEREYA